MKKLIELGASIDAAICAADEYDGGYNFERDRKIRDALMALPTVDAVPVVHGMWIDTTFKAWGLVHHPYKCNQCGYNSEAPSDYCPDCGAKMDVKDGEPI